MVDKILKFKETLAYKKIHEEYDKGKLSHAYIIECQDMESAYMFALLVSSLILKDENLQSPTASKIISSSHPDVLTFPRKDKMLVSDSEEIIQNASLSPLLSDKKIFILKNFDEATEASANKLLKLIEEPNESTHFLILTKAIRNVLPTIRSRCKSLILNAFKPYQIAEFVKSKNALNFGNGYLFLSLDLDKNSKFDEICDNCIDTILNMLTSSKVLFYSKKIGSGDFVLKLKVLQVMFEDLLKIKSGKEEFAIMKLYTESLKTAMNGFSFNAIVQIVHLINETKKMFDSNVQENLLIDRLLIKILEVKYICK